MAERPLHNRATTLLATLAHGSGERARSAEPPASRSRTLSDGAIDDLYHTCAVEAQVPARGCRVPRLRKHHGAQRNGL